eukprot:TRINITY_DN11716_c0_g1_i1.p1 TRINITY_DN11716_c0_g1~~TRINITY_DN11716_c0_g1_i1.p1  ORF type:complete len:196 (-),score=51.15 TRINITY_DN11716_c0_g1_i1:120-638(-)
MADKYLSKLKTFHFEDWSDFIRTTEFKPPTSGPEVFQRLKSNTEFYVVNYLAFVALGFVIGGYFSFALMITLIIAGICGAAIHFSKAHAIQLGGVTVTTQMKLGVAGVIILFSVYMGETVWPIAFSAFLGFVLVAVHAVLKVPKGAVAQTFAEARTTGTNVAADLENEKKLE